MKRSFLHIAVCLAILPASGNLVADSVAAMCLDANKTPEVCDCAAERLAAEVGENGYGLYEAVGAAYRDNLAAGAGRGDAWDAAVKAVADRNGAGATATLQRTNRIGKAHRQAMKACAG
jgi:hypothetical protein